MKVHVSRGPLHPQHVYCGAGARKRSNGDVPTTLEPGDATCLVCLRLFERQCREDLVATMRQIQRIEYGEVQ